MKIFIVDYETLMVAQDKEQAERYLRKIDHSEEPGSDVTQNYLTSKTKGLAESARHLLSLNKVGLVVAGISTVQGKGHSHFIRIDDDFDFNPIFDVEDI